MGDSGGGPFVASKPNDLAGKRRGFGSPGMGDSGGGPSVASEPNDLAGKRRGFRSRSTPGNRNKNGIKPIGLDKYKLNTPGRESFSENVLSRWLVAGRKRLPTPLSSLMQRHHGCLLLDDHVPSCFVLQFASGGNPSNKPPANPSSSSTGNSYRSARATLDVYNRPACCTKRCCSPEGRRKCAEGMLESSKFHCSPASSQAVAPATAWSAESLPPPDSPRSPGRDPVRRLRSGGCVCRAEGIY